ncbi:hypothetical protein E5163_08810 [Marinicauda algicola]|uniref:Uncharacterized protein n=1 Tax=Marinicauda algicola TaxID=2029849 RepID=A0A4S2H1L1_9PROT|nr:hypothetical protein [Marinicauda algicola]TGY89208.1 hypothetical protein E5163_08810 [Marinicauda algicola]
MKIALFTIAAAALAVIAIFLSDALNRAAVGLNSEGSRESGKKFGIKIGTSFDEALQILQQKGFNLVTYGEEVRCSYVERDRYNGYQFYDDSWRKASVCLAVVDQEVVAISWWVNPFTP